MHCRKVQEEPHRMFVVVFEPGEDPIAGLKQLADDVLLATSRFTAIGGFSEAVLGWFDPEAKDYKRIPVNEQVEVVSLAGNIVDSDDGRRPHAHVVLGTSDGRALGGHLLEARVRPTLELVLNESPAHLARYYDAESHIPLIGV